MVKGLARFTEHFADFGDSYALIGGAACDVLFGEAGIDFRATKDLDVVLCIEVVDSAFAARFQEFLDAGGYSARERSSGRKEFYRFHKPERADYPAMIELFARRPDVPLLPEDATLSPIPIEDEALSLSAILVDDDYYNLLLERRVAKNGLSLIDAATLIPFKARAFLDLSRRHAAGERVASKDIRKHRADVFRLTQLLPATGKIDVADQIRSDLTAFINDVETDGYDPSAVVPGLALDDGATLLGRFYGLEA
ncbi:hypothetical protein [Parvularcula dongshanensis]|uniref:Nucleotidyl transferase AbiEii/AbiGii toxin family protein n=1 Tax=Parvularcula dongshanensis TaxID=1173995 RepID=A0A840I7J0_9PROT|nr:hypothetical protein [Parvularcula dongshanensis]MBB4660241.1 hypothetical protein [Parvularcula dongshanensis]